MADKQHPVLVKVRQYLVAGILTVIPIWGTYAIVNLMLELLANVGKPAVEFAAEMLKEPAPWLAERLVTPLFQSIVAVMTVVIALLLLGWGARRVIGQRFLKLVDSLIERIPMVQTIYSGLKKLISVLDTKPEGSERVVLIDFPSPEMKTVGLVTRAFKDSTTGRELLAVYVPTTPNPTSGYLEIVPKERVTATDWTVDQAMTFIVSGGAVAPDTMHYDSPV